jgi:hypothetical protein
VLLATRLHRTSLLALFAIRDFHQSRGGLGAPDRVHRVGVIGTLSGGWLADHWQRIGTLRLGYGLAGIASGVTLGLATSAGGVAARCSACWRTRTA